MVITAKYSLLSNIVDTIVTRVMCISGIPCKFIFLGLFNDLNKQIRWHVFTPWVTTTCRSLADHSGVAVERQPTKRRNISIATQTFTHYKSRRHSPFVCCYNLFVHFWQQNTLQKTLVITWTQAKITSRQRCWRCSDSYWKHSHRAARSSSVAIGISGALRE